MLIKYKNQDLGLLFVRLGLSFLFFVEVYTKITTFGGTAKFFSVIGLGTPMLYFIIFIELVAAIVMLLGVLSEWGYIIVIEMLYIILFIQLPHGGVTHISLELMVLVAALLIALTGPGKYSLESHFSELKK